MDQAKLTEVREKVEASDLKGATLLLKALRPAESQVSNLLSRINDLYQREHAGTISEEEHKTTKNQLRIAILALILDWENEPHAINNDKIHLQDDSTKKVSSTNTKDMQTIYDQPERRPLTHFPHAELDAVHHQLAFTKQHLNALIPDGQYTAAVTRLLVTLETKLEQLSQQIINAGHLGTPFDIAVRAFLNQTEKSLSEIAEARRKKDIARCRDFVRDHIVPYFTYELDKFLTQINKIW